MASIYALGGVSMERFDRLRELVSSLDPQHVYRTIYDEHLHPVIDGVQALDPVGLADFSKMDFSGKTVVDLGCNFGFFSFQARRMGAAHVLGVDREPGVLEGAAMLRDIFGLDHVDFLACDIEARENSLSGRTFDVAMLVEFIGKTYVRQGRILDMLRVMERLAHKDLVLSVQKSYMIHKELGASPAEMGALYPGAYIRDGEVLILDLVRDFLKDRWQVDMLSSLNPGYEKPRKFLRCRKKT